MRKLALKLLSLTLVVALLLASSTVIASAITWDNVPETNYADRYTSSYYTYGKYYKNMTQIPLTGDGARDTVAVAMSQVNYLEGDSSYYQYGEVAGSGNYTEYGAYTGVNASAWCASFCSWALYTAECTSTRGTESYMARNGYYWSECYVPYWSQMLYNNGRYKYGHYYGGSYMPQPGDLIFFTYYATPLDEDHIGLVVYSDDSYVYTIEGNTSSQSGLDSEGGGVFFKRYSLWNSNVAGYGVMPYNTVSDLPAIDYSGANPTPGLYINPLGGCNVYFNRDDTVPSWWLPVSSVFEVTKIDYDNLGNTMLKVKCEIDSTIVYGWIIHNSSFDSSTRTLQIYASPDLTPELESSRYDITEDNMIAGLTTGKTVSQLLSGLTSTKDDTEIKVYKGNAEVSGSSALGTGMTVKIFQDGSEVNAYEVVVKGDANGDGKITGIDYLLIKRHVLGNYTLNGANLAACSIETSGKVSVTDYILTKRAVMGTYTIS